MAISLVIAASAKGAWVLSEDGTRREAKAGDLLLETDTLLVPDGQEVILQDPDKLPLFVESGEFSFMELQAQFAEAKEPNQESDTSAEDEIAALQESILAGVDPTKAFEAAAAGGTPDAEPQSSGSSQVASIDRQAEEVIATSGYDTAAPDDQPEVNDAPEDITTNQAPIALSASAPTLVTPEDTSIRITSEQLLSHITDPEGDALSVGSLRLADTSAGTLVDNGDGTWTFVPADNTNGEFELIYDVVDAVGNTTTTSIDVTVTPVNDAPDAQDDTLNAVEDTPLTLGVSDIVSPNDTDVDGDSLVITGVANATNGTVTLNADGTITFTPDANFNGQASFEYTISDGNGGTDTATVVVNVASVNDAPVADDDTASTQEDSAVTLGLSDLVDPNDTDLDGDSLVISGVANATNGSVVLNADGTVTFTPDANFNGQATFEYTISDGNGGFDTATVTIDVGAVDDLTAADDSISTQEDTSVSGSVAGNDSTTSGGSLSFALATDAANGSVTMNADGTYTYTPNDNYHGTDSFTYTVTDAASGESSTQTVTITVGSVDDLSAGDDSNATQEDTAVSGTVAGNDSTTSGGDLSFALATDAANGSVVMNADGTYTYTPNANYHGTDTFTYTVTDAASGESSTQTVTITVGSVDDLTSADDSNSTTEDTAVSGSVAGNDSTTSGGDLSFALATDAANGSVVMNADGTYTYTPNDNYHGTDSFTYTVTDAASGESSTQTVTITVGSVDDLTAGDDSNSTQEDSAVSGTVAGNDSTTSGGSLSFALADDAANGSVTMNADGTYTYTPNANYHGTDSFTYTVTDAASGESSTQTVTITVGSVDDLTSADDSNSTTEDTAVSGSVAGNDSTTSGGDLSFALATDAANGSVVMNADGTYTYTPNANYHGTDSFTYTVTDAASGESSTQTVTITVTPDNADAVLADDSKTVAEDIDATGNVLSNDLADDAALSVKSFSVGEQTVAAGETITLENVGTITIDANGDYVFDPVDDWNGSVPTIIYTTDTDQTAELQITVTPVNDAPVVSDAEGDKAFEDGQGGISFNVKDNFSDEDGADDITGISV
ncbi:retention module-containing protein, partial [Ferrimonas sp.]|uniref:retention module-containing protein n=1 Tax=Ferrimonas sp. TaxID=2080861 RepID=UPI003A926ED2